MGGGAAIRAMAAGKVAGVGVFSGGIRGGLSSATATAPPASQSLRNASRPVGGILSSGKVSAGGDVAEAQKALWELDDWGFAGGENDFLVAPEPKSSEPIARVIFGGAPSLEEAKEATSELKEALKKVYFSSENSSVSEYDGVLPVAAVSGQPLVANSESLETKSCISCDPKSVTGPKHAIQAFEFLRENASAQTVVASIAADSNVWNAVMQNEDLIQFIQSQKNNNMFQDQGSPGEIEELSDLSKEEDTLSHSGDSGGQSRFKPMAALWKIKDRVVELGRTTKDSVVELGRTTGDRVVEMVSNVGNYLQNIFGTPAADKTYAEADGKPAEADAKANYFEKAIGLAIMAIMVIVLKRA
ncbi:hypothetical protein Pint_04347 [Pistacia integerrima]|uniref:Uncharacterized protein n=1 Tax=Pistacia integerrima TaxID=434235 RepID=A0ACC0Z480_9ROSI|nr:hypothetical protein Pint_04347 [Pistacia integerrima]